MKKYKSYCLIKKYPGVKLELGDIIEFDTTKYPNQYICKIKGVGVSAIEPSGFPEFWEEIIEKDYEVSVLYSNNTSFCYLGENGLYYYKASIGCGSTLENCLKAGWGIFSVKRLSDGKVFTIGENASSARYKGSHKIKSFSIRQKVINSSMCGSWNYDGVGRIWVEWDDNAGNTWLESIEHYKPLFTSVDGKEIYKGDIFYVVDNRFFKLRRTCGGNFQNDKWKNIRFASKEKALDYIIYNKPCLSIKDVEYLGSLSSLRKLVESKI